MKKSTVILLAAVSAFLSCQKEETPALTVPVKKVEMSFAANLSEDPNTKASLGSKTGTKTNITWSSDDLISVFDGVGNNSFESSGSGESVRFRGTAAEGKANYYALYPYSESASLNGSNINAAVPLYQACVPGTFDPNAGLSVAATDGDEFSFKQATALLKFTIPADCTKVKYIEFMANNGVAIAGNTSINPYTGVATGGTNSQIQMTRWWQQQGGDYIAPGDYYISVIPGTLSAGFVLRIYSTDGDKFLEKISSKSHTFERGKIYNLGTIPTGGTVYTIGSPLTSKSFSTSTSYLLKNLKYGFYLQANDGSKAYVGTQESAVAVPACRFRFTETGDDANIRTEDGTLYLNFNWKNTNDRNKDYGAYFQSSGCSMKFSYDNSKTAFRIYSNSSPVSYILVKYRSLYANSSTSTSGWLGTTAIPDSSDDSYFWQIIPVVITDSSL